MNHPRWKIVPLGLLGLALAGLAMAANAPAKANAPKNLADQPGVRHVGLIPQAQIPAYIVKAVKSPERPAADRALDAGRKPEQMLAFYGVRPGMRVADLQAGAGWSTQLLSLTVGAKGKVYSQNPPVPPKFKRFQKVIDAWRARTKKMRNVVAVQTSPDSPAMLPVKPGTLDVAWLNMNYHDLVGFGVKMDTFNATIFKDLKPGGVYALTDNSAQPGKGATETTTLHRIGENFVIKQIEKAGFKLAATSSALRNPKDNRTWLIFKHRGQQDRFMLKFVKPGKVAAAPARAKRG